MKNAAVAVDISIRTEVFYPETDDMPMPDAYYQSEHFQNLIAMLKVFFRLRDDVVVSGDIFIYYVEGDNNRRVAPDCFVVIGVSRESFERNNTYLMWDVGKSPDFVLEIGSPSTGLKDTGPKRRLYASLGVGEYWMFDPSGGEHYGFALRGERLVDGEYRPLETQEDAEGSVWGYSATLNLELHWVEGFLRLYDPVGERWLETPLEIDEARESERVARASAEAALDTAEGRVAELEAELRRLRGQG